MLKARIPSFAAALVVVAACAACPAPTSEGEGEGEADEPKDVALRFAARVNGADIDCNATYDNVGTTASTLTVHDLRFYVSNVALFAGADRHDVVIDEVAPFLGSGVALMDFEDGTGACADAGNAAKNDVVSGVVDADLAYDAVEFDVGIPEEQNHLDPATLAPPLNISSLFWGWTAGYIFLKTDLSSTGQPGGFFVHIGSAVCEGDGADATCGAQNLLHVRLDGFNADSTVVFDLGTVLENANIDENAAASAPGCMSAPDDTDCPPIFDAFGLPFGGGAAPSASAAFTLE